MRVRDKIVYEVDDDDEDDNESDYDEEELLQELEDSIYSKSMCFFLNFKDYVNNGGLYLGEYLTVDKIDEFAKEIILLQNNC
tara:strand:- start:1286 stop:1531 length:246 start_codon:yes stop_codon:yes gene_type:complete